MVGEGGWSFADFVVNANHSSLTSDAVQIVQRLPFCCSGLVWYNDAYDEESEEAEGYHCYLLGDLRKRDRTGGRVCCTLKPLRRTELARNE